MKKRVLSMLLVLVMVLGMLPVQTFAAENTVQISNAFCTITPALAEYKEETVTYNGQWTGTAEIPKYTVQIPNGTQTVTLKLGNSLCLTPDYADQSIIYYYYIPLVYDEENLRYNGGYATQMGEYTLLSATESSIELNVASIIESGELFGVIDGNYNVVYAIEFAYAPSDETENVPVEGISLDKTSVTLDAQKSEQVTLVPTISPANATNQNIVWSSSNAAVASVENGVVTAMESGTATITALCGTETATCEVRVERSIVNLSIYPSDTVEITVAVDEEVDIVACCSPKTTTQNTVTYTSSDPDVVSVAQAEVTPYDAYGHVTNKVRGKQVGQATITVAAKSNPALYDTVTVKVVSCTHKEANAAYEQVAGTENHTVTVTCKKCYEQIGTVTTENCTDEDRDGKCDKCKGNVCLHENKTTAYKQVDGQEKHTVTVTCNGCGNTVGEVTTADCVDENRNGKCDKCEGTVTVPCLHEEKTTAYVQVTGTETHTVTVTCDQCHEVVGEVTTEDCVDEAKDGACDRCGGTVAIPAPEPGTDETGAYLLGSAADLLWFAAKVNGGEKNISAKLTADIVIPSKQWTPMTGFSGTFDGDGKTVKLIDATQGLFTSVTGTSSKRAEVKNVTVDGNISGSGNVAGIAGTAYYANFTNCINKANVSGSSKTAGIVGYSQTSSGSVGSFITLQNCGNTGTISGGTCVAGIVGYLKGSAVINDCYNSGNISGSAITNNGSQAGVGGVIGAAQGYSNASSLTNCYNTGVVNGGSGYAGGLIGSMYNKISATNCYNAGTVTGGSNKIGAFSCYAHKTSTSATNCYYLDTSCATAVATNNSTSTVKVTAKPEEEMKSAEFASALGSGYKANPNGYPVLAWQTVSAGSVTYNVTKPTTEGITFDGGETAFSTQAYEFTVTINDYYRANDRFAVMVNGDALEPESASGKVYTYKIESPAADLVITVEGVESTGTVIWAGKKPDLSYYVSEIKIYDVTVETVTVNGDDINITLAEGTDLAMSIRFTLSHNGNWSAGGMSGCHLSFTPGEDFIKELSGGRLQQTVTAASGGYTGTWNINISVAGLEAAEYVDVTKPTSDRYTVSGLDTAIKGSSYNFTVKLNSRYIATEEFAVKANGQKLELVNGEYTVANVSENIEITVEGVALRTLSGITAGGNTISSEPEGLYTVLGGTWDSPGSTPYNNIPYYIIRVPYGTQTVKVTYSSYWRPTSSGSQGGIVGWSYNPITLVDDVPHSGTYNTFADVVYTTNTDGTYTIELAVNSYLLENNKGFSLVDSSLGFVDVLTFVVEDCTHPAENIKTTYAALPGTDTHTVIRTCMKCNSQVSSTTGNCIDTDPKDDKCDLCKGDATVAVVSVTLSKTEAKREIGKSLQLTASILPANATDQTVTWSSSNESVATVDDTGKVTALAVGTAVITAKAGGLEAECTVTVTEVANRVTAYLSISHDDDYVVGQETGTVMVLQQMEVPWFDLTPYGLEMYTIPSTDEGYQKPTVLHMYIYATEVYYLGVPADEAGQGQLAESGKQQDLLVPSQGAGSMYLKKFWGYSENLRYFLNYIYPADAEGWGYTADIMVLSEGDAITLGHHDYWEAHADPANGFLNFTKDGNKLVATSVLQGDELTLQLNLNGGGMGGANTHRLVPNTDVYYVRADEAANGDVSTWTKLGTTDADGLLRTTVSMAPGTYYLAVAGRRGDNATDKIVSSPGAVILTVLENAADSPVRKVMELIDDIGEVTLDSEEAINAARIAYDALDDQALQDAVSNYSDLTDAETKLAELKKAKADQEKADDFAAKVEAIGTVEVSDACKSKIDIAKAAYELLTAEQKELAKAAKAKLDQADKDYAKLVADENDKQAAHAVEQKITAIGTVSLNSEAAIQEARTAYNGLSDIQKQLVENYVILQAAEKKLTDLKDEAAANAVEEKIAAIGTVILDSEEKIKAARTAYDALTDAQKALVENLAVLEAAEEALELLKLAGTDITEMYQEAGSYLSGLSAPGVGSTNGEWRVIGLYRGGKSTADGYYDAVVRFVEENIDEDGRLHENKSTENSRIILALTAIGKDVTNVEGYDLLAGLNSMEYIGNQGINGTIWALIAFDSHDYEIPAGDVTREKLVQTIVSKQCADGGWSLSGIAGDPDITGMALQALAPYYQTDSSVKTAVDKALTWLSGIQAKDGTFSCSEGVTSESLAQVITGLTALGINPETDSRFVKNGVSAMDALSRFYLGDGSFEHGLGSGRNMMATEQAYYALVSYYRLLQGKTALYDMSDVTIVIPVYKIIEGANSDWQRDDDALTIRADGDFAMFTGVKVDGATVDSKHYTAKAGSTIITFTAEYLKTLSEGVHVITVSFTDGEASTTVTVMPTDEEVAKQVINLIAAIGAVTEDSGNKIKTARNAYDALTDGQKALVTNYKTLTDAESAYDLLVSKISVSFTLLGCSEHGEGAVHTLAGGNLSTWIGAKTYRVESGATVRDVLEMALKEAGLAWKNPTGNYVESINGIGEFTNGSNSGWMYTLNGVHPNLGVAQQTVKDGDVIVFHYTDDYTKEASGQGFADRDEAAAEATEKLIDDIGTVTLNSKDKIDAARKAYDALTYTQKQKVANYQKLTDAEARFTELKEADDEQKAEEVEKLIKLIDFENPQESEQEIAAARKAYNALTAAQRKLVGNYGKLTDAEYDLALLKADEEDKKAAEAAEKLINAIGTVALKSEDKVQAARDAYDKLTDTQKALVKNYEKLEKAEVKLAELKELAAVDGAYKATGDYLEDLGTPAPGSVGGEWMVIGLIRSGRTLEDADGYYDAVVKFVQENADGNGRLHNAKSTENSRIILALTAMGKDVTDVDGHNLLDGLNDMEYVQKQGINGPIWALIAFDSGNYPVPAGDVTRESLIQVILDAQLADGGWALSGSLSDPDMTGMALQALAPYYKTDAAVKKAVDEAIEALSKMQAADGSFAGIDGTSSESVAQVIAALAALGIDADKDTRFIKNGVSALDALCAFFVEGGGFKHIPDGKLDGMATEQSYYALAAYFRMLEGKVSLFDMTDVIDMGGDAVVEEPVETQPAATEPVPTQPAQTPAEEDGGFPWLLVIVIVVLAGAIAVLVIISKPKKRSKVR